MAKLPITPRPIKYRAFNGKEMLIVQSLCFNHECIVWYGPHPHLGVSCTFDSPSWSEENPRPSEGDLKPVMQWTGLHDKNGVEIFEGDILSDTDGHFGAVLFGDFSDNEHVPHRGWYVGWTDDPEWDNGLSSVTAPYRIVVGNVYQNQDLLSS